MDKKLRIGVLFGGKSSEKEISLATGRYIYQLIDQAKFIALALFMDDSGAIWEIPDKLVIQNTTKDLILRLENDAKKIRYEDLKNKIDIVFNALLGKYGEDGCIQGLLEVLGVPYTGSGILASAVSMDKKVTREILQGNRYKIPKGIVVSEKDVSVVNVRSNPPSPGFAGLRRTRIEDLRTKIEKEIGYPCVVKPTREGSSVGVVVAHGDDDFKKAMEKSFYFDREILIEEYIKGREFMCVVYGNDNPEAMLPTEVVFEGEIHTYESKYMPGGAQYFTPIRIEEDLVKTIQKQAEEIYRLLGIKGYGRVDGFVKGNDIYISEVHTGTIMVPSSYVFHEVSRTKVQLKGGKGNIPMSPRMWVTKIIEMGVEAHRTKKSLL